MNALTENDEFGRGDGEKAPEIFARIREGVAASLLPYDGVI